MANVVCSGRLPFYARLNSTLGCRSILHIAAAATQSNEVQVEPKRKTAKLHRTWTAGRRVSSEKYARDTDSAENKKIRLSGEPLDRIEQSEEETESETDADDEDEDEDYYNEEVEEEEQIEVEESRSNNQIDAHLEFSELKCKHFSRCSGCVFETDLNNPPIVRRAAPFLLKRGIANFSLRPSSAWGWRCRAKLAVRGTPTDPVIGLFEFDTHHAVDIPACRAHHPTINAAVELVKQAIRELGVQPYDERTLSGDLRYIQAVVNVYDTKLAAEDRYKNGKVQLTLVWNSRREDYAPLLQKMNKCLWQLGGPRSSAHILHSLWANFQTSENNVILGHRWRHIVGDQELWEHVGGVDICYTPASFGQANYRVYDDLLKTLRKYVKKGSAAIDLYAGVGVIGLSLARKCRSVKCVEVNKHSKLSFERSVSRLPSDISCDISWHCADATESPITWFEGSDVVIVDPPRKGLEPPVIEALRLSALRAQGKHRSPSLTSDRVEKRPWILRAMKEGVRKEGAAINEEETGGVWPERLIYVSCALDAFKRDCEALEYDGAWHLERAHGFNFFPGTDSIEILAVFVTGKRPKKKTIKKKLLIEAKLLAKKRAAR